LVELHQNFNAKRLELLDERKHRKISIKEFFQNFFQKPKKSEQEIGFAIHFLKICWIEEWKLLGQLIEK
jgi:malate synthase